VPSEVHEHASFRVRSSANDRIPVATSLIGSGMRSLLLGVAVVVVLGCGSGKSSTVAPASGSGSGSTSGSGSAVSREDCRAILEKADKLMGHDSTGHPRDPAKTEREIDECVANATPAAIECAKRATTMDELEACEK
jgi:hypothetical protein